MSDIDQKSSREGTAASQQPDASRTDSPTTSIDAKVEIKKNRRADALAAAAARRQAEMRNSAKFQDISKKLEIIKEMEQKVDAEFETY